MKKLSAVLVLFILLLCLNIPIEAESSQLIIVNKQTNTLAFYNAGNLVNIFSVATGRSRDLTPEGNFQIVKKIVNRPYYSGGIPGGDPRNPLGDRWMGLNARGTYGDTYGIHGNNNESSIGNYVSSGCIRMHNDEVRWLYDQVSLYTPVIITYSSYSFDEIAKANGYDVTSNGWVKVNGQWSYYSNGQVQTGWAYLGDQWYYFDSTGVMQTGWVASGGQWYFLNSSGAMRTGWVYNNSLWYYLDSSGAMRTGWVYNNSAWYYLDSSGAMKTGWVYDNGMWYYLDSGGAMKTDWVYYNGKWYYLDSNGAMKTGWVSDNGVRYYLDEPSGVMKTGWVYNNGVWYYLDEPSGAMKTGWVYNNGKWYYLEPSGPMKTGWLVTEGYQYYLDAYSGVMKTGWAEIDGKWYYFYQNGHMASDTVIGGYNLGKDGAWIQVYYVALGDSLAAGMTPQGQDRPPVNGVDPDWGYPNYIAEDFAQSYQLLKFANFGVSGHKADDVIADLDNEAVQQEIKKATHLTIDIGANDLLPVVQANPSQAPAEIATIAGKLNTILNMIDQLNPNVKVYVMGYYNPFPYVTDEQQKAQLNQLLNAFNDQIQAQAIGHGDTFVPTAQVINVSNFADYIPNPQNIHLSLPGYQAVAAEFWKVIQNQ